MTAWWIPVFGLQPLSAQDTYDFGSSAAVRPSGGIVTSVDPSTGAIESTRRPHHPVDAAVIWGLRVRRNSGASVTEVGHRFDELRLIDDSAARRLTDELRRIFQPLETRGWLTVERYAAEAPVEGTEDMGAGLVVYRNNLSNRRMVARSP